MKQFLRRFFRFSGGQAGSLLGAVLGLAGVFAVAAFAAAGTFPAWLGAVIVACVVTSAVVIELELSFRRRPKGEEVDERRLWPTP